MSNNNPATNIHTSEPMVLASKKMVLFRNILGLVISAAAAVAALILDNQGVRLLLFNKTQSLMFTLCILFSCIAGYYILMLISLLQIHVKHGGESEITMLGRFYRVLTGFALLVGVAYLLGKIDAFTSFFTL
jgi:hypothetical protein